MCCAGAGARFWRRSTDTPQAFAYRPRRTRALEGGGANGSFGEQMSGIIDVFFLGTCECNDQNPMYSWNEHITHGINNGPL